MNYILRDNINEIAKACIDRKFADIKKAALEEAKELFVKRMMEGMVDVKSFIEMGCSRLEDKVIVELRIRDDNKELEKIINDTAYDIVQGTVNKQSTQ